MLEESLELGTNGSLSLGDFQLGYVIFNSTTAKDLFREKLRQLAVYEDWLNAEPDEIPL